jgi:glutathione synthase/RimK-type ligase-like ATP-grasp enzyme
LKCIERKRGQALALCTANRSAGHPSSPCRISFGRRSLSIRIPDSGITGGPNEQDLQIQNRTPHHAPSDGASDWAPRLRQEERLRALDGLLARSPDAIDIAIERAALLAALDRHDDAKAAFIAILRRAPTNFVALNEFGALLARLGAIDAACRLYAEAIAHHPANPIGHVNLGNLDWRAGRHELARTRFEAALRIDPDHAAAHQGLGAVLSDLGEHAAARVHLERGFRGRAIVSLPYRGTRPPLPVLQLVAAGGGNIPTASFLDDREFLTIVVVADQIDPADALPAHRLVFNAIGDADLCSEALAAATRLVARTTAPVINPPAVVERTSRSETARRLDGLPGVIAPRMARVPRADLTRADAAAMLERHGLSFPLLLRSPGYHTGQNFLRLSAADELAAAVAALPGDELLAIEFLDARGADGNARKYRVMFIDGALYPVHLAIAQNWKVHYFTSDMAARADHRTEEEAFLNDMSGTLGAPAMAALALIRDTLGLDYGGIDFGIGADGKVLLFEANATMVLVPPEGDERFAYRREAIRRALDAVTAMIRARASGGA